MRVGTRLISFYTDSTSEHDTPGTEQTNNIIVGLVPHLATTVLRYETLGDLLCTKLSTHKAVSNVNKVYIINRTRVVPYIRSHAEAA